MSQEDEKKVAPALRDTISDGGPSDEVTRFEASPQRYEMRSFLGRGGVGCVHLAWDNQLEREVAVKTLQEPLQRDLDTQSRFFYEARVTARLAHPGVVPVHDLGALPDGRLFYSMQRVAGRNLHDVLEALRAEDAEATEQFPLPRLLAVFRQVCLTMAYAHARNIVHRDLKPENVLLGEYGEVFVADWGLAKGLEGDSRDRETTPGAVLGTIFYMSPEQVRGDQDEHEQGTDVWSLGVMLYELLTLDLPFDGASLVNVMFKIVSADPEPPTTNRFGRPAPEPLAALAIQALRKDVAERRLTARQLADGIAAFLDGVEEARRREERAAKLLRRAEELRAGVEAARMVLSEERNALREATEALEPTASAATRRALWGRAQALDESVVDLSVRHSEALQTATQSLEEAPSEAAHALVAELYWWRALDSAAAHDRAGEAHFRRLAEAHDRGALSDQLAQNGRVELSLPEDATWRFEHFRPFGPLLEPRPKDLDLESVPVGSYVLVAERPDCLPLRLPFQVQGNRTTELSVDLPPRFPEAQDYVLISAGRWQLGGDPEAPRGLPSTEVELPAFLIGRHPVTMGEYVEFLNALEDPQRAIAHAPRSQDGRYQYLDHDAQTGLFTVPEVDADGDEWDPSWPVLGVNHDDAVAYCAWRGEREQALLRLPTELEWELAARGTDGRVFPWGNGFDPSLCHMADSKDGRPLPVAIGSYPHDRSPWGVRDCAGLVIEWTSTRVGTDVVQRGAGATSPPAWCRVGARRTHAPTWLAPQFGFRVLREL